MEKFITIILGLFFLYLIGSFLIPFLLLLLKLIIAFLSLIALLLIKIANILYPNNENNVNQ